ncbi:MAG: type II toxin-antitoxin system HicA family toxin [Saprospiraceae bacterium]
MKPLSGREVCSILLRHGFHNVRQKGSHVIMQKIVSDSTITVPVPMHKKLREGTLRSIIRQSGLAKRDFE